LDALFVCYLLFLKVPLKDTGWFMKPFSTKAEFIITDTEKSMRALTSIAIDIQ
jgi:hypothetical protein